MAFRSRGVPIEQHRHGSRPEAQARMDKAVDAALTDSNIIPADTPNDRRVHLSG